MVRHEAVAEPRPADAGVSPGGAFIPRDTLSRNCVMKKRLNIAV
jgi:hypothetical protein